MTSKADFMREWKDETPETRRATLNELGAIAEKDENEQREHDVLAELVAKDEEEAQKQ
jgi:hypothetical protein